MGRRKDPGRKALAAAVREGAAQAQVTGVLRAAESFLERFAREFPDLDEAERGQILMLAVARLAVSRGMSERRFLAASRNALHAIAGALMLEERGSR